METLIRENNSTVYCTFLASPLQGHFLPPPLANLGTALFPGRNVKRDLAMHVYIYLQARI